jgi:endonuclease YncB( thermonuclease family)
MLGKVTRVIDGDTFEIRVTVQEYYHTGITVKDLLLRCRIGNINSPEMSKNVGKLARAFLVGLLPIDTVIEFDPNLRDKYGRYIVTFIPSIGNIDEIMVLEGWAYHYDMLSTKPKLINYERTAQDKQVGIWTEESIIELYKV